MGNDYTVKISNLTMTTNMINDIQRTRDEYSKQMERISSGKKYIQRSDSPADTDEAARIHNDLKANNQWRKNVQLAQGWEAASEARLATIMQITHRLNEIEVTANNGTLSPNDRKGLGEEVNGLIESMLIEANSKYIGTPIFGGTDTDTLPFAATRDANNKITALTYNGGTNKRKIQTAEGTTSDFGLVGTGSDGIFQFDSIEGDPPVTNTVNVFDNLIAFRDALEDGDTPSNTIMKRVNRTVDHMANKVIDNAVSQQKLKRLENNMNVSEQSAVTRLSNVEDLDIAEAISQLSQLESSLQASMQLVGRMNEMSILNYI